MTMVRSREEAREEVTDPPDDVAALPRLHLFVEVGAAVLAVVPEPLPVAVDPPAARAVAHAHAHRIVARVAARARGRLEAAARPAELAVRRRRLGAHARVAGRRRRSVGRAVAWVRM